MDPADAMESAMLNAISPTMPQAGWRCPRCELMITYDLVETDDVDPASNTFPVRIQHGPNPEHSIQLPNGATTELLEWLVRIHAR